jgi:diguanylate cyclase (GGDEF)-like protein
MLDLDRFKDINDTLGHHHGDELLKQVGARITATLRHADTVARLGGDEFTVLLPEVAGSEAAAGVADKIARALEGSFVVEGVTIDMEASVGIAIYPDHGPDIDSLLQHADIAMYEAKRNHSSVATYSEEFGGGTPRRLALLGELRRALEVHELVVYYQPKVDMASRAVIGVEALLRWKHPELGLVPPSDFIPLAEGTGLIHPLTEYVLNDSLKQAHQWAAAGSPLAVAVNISARSLLNEDFPDMVSRLLAEWNVPAELLELEITENTLMRDPKHARRALLRLREMGVTLSIDDFGTGYSSLSYLNQLPVHSVKIDRSFIAELPQHAANRLIVTSIVGLGRDLGMKVIAEGVESEEAWTELAELGCDIAQGYLMTRPMPADALEPWLSNWSESHVPTLPATAAAVA